MQEEQTSETATAQPEDTRPVITHREASWHATVAALRARRKAAAQSTAPEAREAFAMAAAAIPVGETPSPEFQPRITIGTLWAIEISSENQSNLTDGGIYENQALWALTLTQPERVLLSLLGGDADDIREGMIESATLPAESYYALDSWYSREISNLEALSGSGHQEDTALGKRMATPPPSSGDQQTPPGGPLP